MIIDTYLRLLGADLATTLTLSDLGILVGILTGLLGALVNLVYTWRKDRREQRESDAAWARRRKEK
jgi:ABC-type amino acid transport system permease subunit